MEYIIEDMILSAYRHDDREMATFVYKLLFEMSVSYHESIGKKMAEKFSGWKWIMDNCNLYDFLEG